MLSIAFILHIIGRLLPKWILKGKYSTIKNKFHWKRSLFHFSGLVFSLLCASIFISINTLSREKTYIKTKDAIYGFSFNEEMETIGFMDGDRIIAINDSETNKMSNIIPSILLTKDTTKITLLRNKIQQENIITKIERDKLFEILIQNPKAAVISPIMSDPNAPEKKIQISTRKMGIADIWNQLTFLYSESVKMIMPVNRLHANFGGISLETSGKPIWKYLFVLSFYSMLIGILNFIPLPGFCMGNAMVSTLENFKKKHFNKIFINTISAISILLVIAFILFL